MKKKKNNSKWELKFRLFMLRLVLQPPAQCGYLYQEQCFVGAYKGWEQLHFLPCGKRWPLLPWHVGPECVFPDVPPIQLPLSWL